MLKVDTDTRAHMEAQHPGIREAIRGMAATVRARLLDEQLDDEARQRRFVDWMVGMCRERLPDAERVRRYEAAVSLEHGWQGLARY